MQVLCPGFLGMVGQRKIVFVVLLKESPSSKLCSFKNCIHSWMLTMRHHSHIVCQSRRLIPSQPALLLGNRDVGLHKCFSNEHFSEREPRSYFKVRLNALQPEMAGVFAANVTAARWKVKTTGGQHRQDFRDHFFFICLEDELVLRWLQYFKPI